MGDKETNELESDRGSNQDKSEYIARRQNNHVNNEHVKAKRERLERNTLLVQMKDKTYVYLL